MKGEPRWRGELRCCDVFLCFCKVSEYRVSDPGILKSIGVSVSNTGVEVSEDGVSDTEKSIGCPALLNLSTII
jgi:hypothetical protein